MNRRLILAGLAATGGLVTSAFLQIAVAAADAPSADAFTIGDFTFDPGAGGFDPVGPLSITAPFLELGGGESLGLNFAPQTLEVFNSAGTDLGSVDTNETVTNLLGLTNAEFTVLDDNAAAGASASDLPTVGSVYDALNLGNGYENIYTDIPGTAGAPDTITDELVTPFGNVNLDSLFGGIDAAAPLQPGDAFTGLDVGDISNAPDAFSIGGFTLDPTLAAGGEGFDAVSPLADSPPLLEIGGGIPLGIPVATQDFDVYDGTTQVGTISTGEDVTNLLGLTNTEFTVLSATPGTGDSAADLPTVGSVYDAFNLGNGWENVYTAVPGAAGAPDTVTDTLVTPFGNVDLDSLFGSIDAAAPMNPGDAFTGLEAGDSSIGANAFTIDGTIFDPINGGATDGFDPVSPLFGAAPLLELGGGTLNVDGVTLGLAQQGFDIDDGTGSTVGSINTEEDVTNLLGLTNTEFTVTSVTGTSADLPTVGSVYDAFNFGDGIENVYTAIPGVDGAADTVTDTLVTPLGNIDLSSLFGGFDAIAALDPGDAFTGGLDAATAAASAVDPLAFLGL
jgi:hypothetical protein